MNRTSSIKPSDGPRQSDRSPFRPAWVSLGAAAPFLTLQAAFLTDAYSWSVTLFGYGAIVLAIGLAFLGWWTFFFIEYRWRLHAAEKAFPAFSVVGAPMLLAFFLPAMLIRPFVMQIPDLCRATQSIQWSTSKPWPEWKNKHCFALVLVGTGTRSNHKFTDGYMNWTGSEPAGFTSVGFHPISFQYNYYEPLHDGTFELLRNRMSTSGIPETELDSISKDVWDLLSRVEQGQSVRAASGVVDAVWSDVDKQWDLFIGGWIWMVIVIVSFQVAGFSTIQSSATQRDASTV